MYPPTTTATSAASPPPPLINQDLASAVFSFAGDKCQPTDVAALAFAVVVNQEWS
jgi:hypothetical protein